MARPVILHPLSYNINFILYVLYGKHCKIFCAYYKNMCMYHVKLDLDLQ